VLMEVEISQGRLDFLNCGFNCFKRLTLREEQCLLVVGSLTFPIECWV